MAGLRKAKQYDWKDSNLALFGSDTERKVKKESAESEPAWQGAGQEVGVEVWRIVKFKVEKWPKEQYGEFYNGDSYIVLRTYKDEDSDELLYDVHFWIGKYSTQDEYGTAAYKTVELDTFLDDKPIQHREVMGHESELFKSYFPTMTLLKGGADTGFRRVLPEQYKTRLLHFCGERKTIEINEVPCKRSSLNSNDVFILDLGLKIYQWNGSDCNKDEKFRAVQYLQQLKSERSGKPKVETMDEDTTSPSNKFFANFKDDEGDDDDDDDSAYEAQDKTPELYRLSNESGHMEFTLKTSGSIDKSQLETDDVFIVDLKSQLFVWVGKGASVDERLNAMSYAHKYLQQTDHPLVSVTCLSEDKKSEAFETALAA